ncbi:MAG: creatininase family protein [Aliishimia sp.]
MTETSWARLKAHELRNLAAQNAVVILPVASIEQHGPHLPVMTDSRIGEEIARRAAEAAYPNRPTIWAPVIWSGLSEHHMAYGGTLTLSHATFRAMIEDLIHAIIRAGFHDILISNSHGGNVIALQSILDELTSEVDATLVLTTYVAEAGTRYGEILEDQDTVMHAGEAETSMMMVCAADTVDSSDLASHNVGGTSGPGFLKAGEASYRWRPLPHITPNGVIGKPEKATAEKGEALLQVGADAVARLICDPTTWEAPKDLRQDETGGVALKDWRA